MRVFHLLLLSGLGFPAAASVESLCQQLAAGRDQSNVEHRILADLCSTSVDTHRGSWVRLGRGQLPLPKEFYLEIPGEEMILFASPLKRSGETAEELFDWPFGTIQITQESQVKGRDDIDFERISSPSVDLAADACGMDMSIRSFRYSPEGWVYEATFAEVKIGGAYILIGGGTTNLAIVLAETYSRLNCKGSE